jgi:protein SCO1/2
MEGLPSELRHRRLAVAALAALFAAAASAHAPTASARLPVIGPAPDFALTDLSGRMLSLADLHGKVLAVAFIFTSCKDACPVLTAKMASLQRGLGDDFGSHVRFVSITVEPERDTPAVLASYARAHRADPLGWSFLTGTRAQIEGVVQRYGAFAKRRGAGDVDHLLLTSLIDRNGMMRVQYLGHRFAPQDMLRDLQALLRE